MNVFTKAERKAKSGATLHPHTSKLGPYKVNPETLTAGLQRAYNLLNQVGASYDKKRLSFGKDACRALTEGSGTVITDSPVTVEAVPHITDKYEDGIDGLGAGWYREIDTVEFYLMGLGEGRRKRVEAAIRQAFGDTHG